MWRKTVYPTAAQTIIFKSTDPCREEKCTLLSQLWRNYRARPAGNASRHRQPQEAHPHPHTDPTLLPPVCWPLLNSAQLSAPRCPSAPLQKPGARFLLLSWAKPSCCRPERSSSATLASFWATPLLTVRGVNSEVACYKKTSDLLFSDLGNVA